MNLISIIPDVVSGAVVIAFLFLILYGLYKFFKMIIPKPKPTPEIYEFVAQHIVSGEPFSKLVEEFSKLKDKEQQQYLRAYTELTKINEMKGGLNGKQKRT